MELINYMDKYPIYTKEIMKSDVNISCTDEFVEMIKEKIKQDDLATFISVFDHYSHTRYMLDWPVSEWMLAWKIVLFCFGMEISDPLVMSVRPRNFAIAEYEDKYIISFLEAPREKANDRMKTWVEDIIKY